MKTVGARIVSIAPGYVVIEWPFSSNLTQQHGFLHAGRTLSVCRAEVQARVEGEETIIAVMQGTMMAVRDNARLVD